MDNTDLLTRGGQVARALGITESDVGRHDLTFQSELGPPSWRAAVEDDLDDYVRGLGDDDREAVIAWALDIYKRKLDQADEAYRARTAAPLRLPATVPQRPDRINRGVRETVAVWKPGSEDSQPRATASRGSRLLGLPLIPVILVGIFVPGILYGLLVVAIGQTGVYVPLFLAIIALWVFASLVKFITRIRR